MSSAELKSRATMQRKNTGRTEKTQRLKSGANLDAVVYDRLARLSEFAVIEASNDQSGGAASSKFLEDKKKIEKTMRDMLYELIRRADFDRAVVDHVHMFGFATSGLTFQVLHMTQHKGHVFLLKTEESRSVPQDVRQFRDFLAVLCRVLESTVSLILSA
jgi:hypothetical protein